MTGDAGPRCQPSRAIPASQSGGQGFLTSFGMTPAVPRSRFPVPAVHGTTVFSGTFAASRFTNRRAAPGTPLGSCRKNANVV